MNEGRSDPSDATREAQPGTTDVGRAADEARRAAEQTRAAADEATRAAHDAAARTREAADRTREAAARSRATALSTRDLVRLAIAEAREALKDTRVEIRVERLSREESRQQTRERLLDAAAEVFNRLGYHGASLEAVAEAAGYTKGAVYSNFATKGELFAALLRRFTERRVATQLTTMEAIPLEALADGAGEMLAQQRREEGAWDLLQIEFWLAAMRDPQLLALLSEGSDDLYREVGEHFERKFAESGLRPPFTGREFARIVNALGSGLLLQLYVEPDAVDPALFGRAIRVLAGLPPPEGERSVDP